MSFKYSLVGLTMSVYAMTLPLVVFVFVINRERERESYYVAQAHLEYLAILPQHPECWNCQCWALCLPIVIEWNETSTVFSVAL